MLGIILKILSVLGILLLVLLGIVLLLLLIVLFYPITYRAQGKKDSTSRNLSVRVNWLFGLLRIRYSYPEPGKLTVKLLWHTFFTSGKEKQDKKAEQGKRSLAKEPKVKPDAATNNPPSESVDSAVPDADEGATAENSAASDNEIPEEDGFGKKNAKIKYTIHHIYDKIKEIWENITYYAELLREEETKQLFSHVCFRIGKIWRHIRPRHINADIMFGTGSPDTTGYLYAVYGMSSPFLGPSVMVTPDFTEKILEGTFSVSGHITVAVLLINALKVLLDRKLMKFIEKMKAGRK